MTLANATGKQTQPRAKRVRPTLLLIPCIHLHDTIYLMPKTMLLVIWVICPWQCSIASSELRSRPGNVDRMDVAVPPKEYMPYTVEGQVRGSELQRCPKCKQASCRLGGTVDLYQPFARTLTVKHASRQKNTNMHYLDSTRIKSFVPS